jgi:hypothetical protein
MPAKTKKVVAKKGAKRVSASKCLTKAQKIASGNYRTRTAPSGRQTLVQTTAYKKAVKAASQKLAKKATKARKSAAKKRVSASKKRVSASKK